MSRLLLRRFSPFLSIRLKLSPFPLQNPNSLLSSRLDLQSRNSSHASTADESQDALHMTENCIQRMKELHTKEASAEGKMLRLSVETGGCSGFQYVFLLDYQRNPDDRVFEKDGVKLVVDKISYDFVKGATVDYVEELIRSAFLRFAGMPHPRILTAYLDESALFLGSGANHKAASTVSSKKLLHRGFTSTFVKA